MGSYRNRAVVKPPVFFFVRDGSRIVIPSSHRGVFHIAPLNKITINFLDNYMRPHIINVPIPNNFPPSGTKAKGYELRL